VKVPSGLTVEQWLLELQRAQTERQGAEHVPLMTLQGWSELGKGEPLFEALFVFENYPVGEAVQGLGGPERDLTLERVDLVETDNYPLTLVVQPGKTLELVLRYDVGRFEEAAIRRMAEHFERLLEQLAASPQGKVEQLSLLSAAERAQVLEGWNQTRRDFPRQGSVHQAFEAQVRRTPRAIAVQAGSERLTFAELNDRANVLAARLRAQSVGPDDKVGVVAERGVGMVVALLGVLKSGAAYVPIDPTYPDDRVRWMVEDSEVQILVTSGQVAEKLDGLAVQRLPEESLRDAPGEQALVGAGGGETLAYVIYTSGSTGRPKGTMVTHRSVLNFFEGMDERLGRDNEGKTWFAVTSISFDISGLELWWALSRGFRVIVREDEARGARAQDALSFSLFYFASGSAQERQPYRLLLEGAKVADREGFSAVWTPERHFHAFGGPYPAPSVAAGALAALTSRVELRAGSVVLPLNDTLRVAEEWAAVDRLAQGRVGLSVASGWHVNDFVLAPDGYADRKERMLRELEALRALWRGEAVRGARLSELPVRSELPVWVTAAGNPETFRHAGRLGANVLTHLLGQDFDELAQKIEEYRKARREAGWEGAGQVSLMVHTFVGTNDSEVKELVRQPFTDYLRTSADLVRTLAQSLELKEGKRVDASDVDALVAHAFERHFESSGLFGGPDTCLRTLERIKRAGVNEVACLIDFGVDDERVLESLGDLSALKARWAARESVSEVLRHEGVTHLQCTPSFLRMLALEPEGWAAVGRLEKLLLGGEALPVKLVAETLEQLEAGELHNMYGPTETTIWSSTEKVREVSGASIPIGTPTANNTFYVLDGHREPVPMGVAGELYIGGEGLARGYWHRPDVTAERFVPDPFGKTSGARMYRTGDLVRWLADGRVEYLGRTDNQVKVRGFRIELGEIEAVLGRLPGVAEAVVAAVGEADTQRLVGYVVPRDTPPPSAEALRAHLSATLPAHMVPGQFLFLERLPLTPNRKVDRKALPRPDMLATRQQAYVAPTDPFEEALAQAWSKVLQVERVGIHDNFFELGGNSLLAMQLSQGIRDAGYNLSLRQLLEGPTVAQQAAKLKHAPKATAKAAPPMVSRRSRKG
jgi:natural product biosynthesis luciferase-like monooxygenase protein